MAFLLPLAEGAVAGGAEAGAAGAAGGAGEGMGAKLFGGRGGSPLDLFGGMGGNHGGGGNNSAKQFPNLALGNAEYHMDASRGTE